MKTPAAHLSISLAVLIAAGCAARSSDVLHEQRSDYNEIIVLQRPDGVRQLRFERGGAIQSAVHPGAPLDLELAYTRASMIALAAVPEPRQILVVGLGGGAMPMFLRTLFPAARIDAVDIDPEVVKVARRYFGFREDPRLVAHVADGRRFVEQSPGGYDLIFLDAYGRSNIPRHLATTEFLATVRARLAPGGLAVGNVWAGDSNDLYGQMRSSWTTAFGEFCELAVSSTSNRVFLARAEPVAFDTAAMTAAAQALSRAHALPFDLAGFARPGCLPGPEVKEPALRDAGGAQ